MKYLLDVNALVALAFIHHEFHDRVVDWVRANRPTIVTTAITELGFVRVLAQVPSYGICIAEARTLLVRLKKNEVYPFTFLADDHDISHLPRWVKSPKQTTVGHLVELARANEVVLATLDEKIPGAYLIA
jgi:predicted nucleic acid-binding protein